MSLGESGHCGMAPCPRTPGDLLCHWLCSGEATTEHQAGFVGPLCSQPGDLSPAEGSRHNRDKYDSRYFHCANSVSGAVLGTGASVLVHSRIH